LFQFKTDFFDIRRVVPIEQKEQVDQQPEPQEYETILSEPVVPEVNNENMSIPEPDQPDADLLKESENDNELVRDQSKVSGVHVFYHPGKVCIDTLNEGVVQDCSNTPVFIIGLTSGVIAKIPVVLAELAVQVNMHSTITLPERALEIKEIKKRVKLTQCLLLQDPEEQIPPVLFLKGFVRNNISYAARGCANSQGVCGDIRHCTVDVPFTCTTQVEFNGADPIIPVINTENEFEYFKRQPLFNRYFAEKDELLSGDFSEINQVTYEFYNELPYCELVSSRIIEYDEFINRTRPGNDLPFEEKEFSQIEDKMVIYLTIKVLQKQQVSIPPFMNALLQRDQVLEVNKENPFYKPLEDIATNVRAEEDFGCEKDEIVQTELQESDLPVQDLEWSRSDMAKEETAEEFPNDTLPLWQPNTTELESYHEETSDSTLENPEDLLLSDTTEPEPSIEDTSNSPPEGFQDLLQPDTTEPEPSIEDTSNSAQEDSEAFLQPDTSNEEHQPKFFDPPTITCPFKRTSN